MRLSSYAKAVQLYENGDMEALSELANAAGGIDKPCLTGGRTILHLCSANNPSKSDGIIEILHKMYPTKNVNPKDKDGIIPLQVAGDAFDVRAVKFLLNHGADAAATMSGELAGQTTNVLFRMCSANKKNSDNSKNRVECIRAVLDSGKAFTGIPYGQLRTAAGEAIENGFLLSAAIIMKNGGPLFPYSVKHDDATFGTAKELTPHDIVAKKLVQMNCGEIIDELCKNYPSFKKAFRETKINGVSYPVHMARNGRHLVVKALLSNGIQFPDDILDDMVEKCLLHAVSAMWKTFAGAGFKPSENLFGRDLLAKFVARYTANKPDVETLITLIDAGEDIHATCQNGKTVFEHLKSTFAGDSSTEVARLNSTLDSTYMLKTHGDTRKTNKSTGL